MKRKTYRQNEYLISLKKDFMNLAQCWVYCVLYYQQIYPPITFQFRTVYGVLTPMTISPKVRDYVTNLFKQLQKSTNLINFLQIQISIDGLPKMSFRFMIQFSEAECQMTRHQKQTQYKYFITRLITGLKEVQYQGKNRTFNFYIQYRYDKLQKLKPGRLQDKWIKSQDQQVPPEAENVVGSSLKLQDMSLLCLRRTFDN